MPDLAIVESIASNTPTRTVTLSGMTVTVLFSCLDAANRLYDWQGAGFDLTPAEIDQIEAILAEARRELMASLVGQVVMWAGENAPENFLLCDGATYARADYPALYNALATFFIVDSANFVVPDLRDRFVLGGATVGDVGASGGEETHTLIESEIPSHSHSIPATATTLAVEPGEVTVLTPIPIITSSTGNTGGGGAHNNMPPFLTLRYYIVAG